MSSSMKKIVVDCATNKQTVLPLTPAEIAELDQSAAAFAEAEAARQAEAERLAALKDSAKSKLLAGEPLTEEEAALLLL